MEILNGYVGCMFSGKSNELMNEFENWRSPFKIYIKFTLKEGLPYRTIIKSHDGKITEGWIAHRISDMVDIEEFANAEFVCLDELHFISDLGSLTIALDDRECSFASIDMDSYGNHISIVGAFLCMAEHIYKKHGVCSKGNHTMYSYRMISDKNPLVEDDGTGFKPICKKCFKKLHEFGIEPH